MPTSMDDRQPRRTGDRCPYESAYSPDLLKRHNRACPADLSLWCVNRILLRVRELETDCHVHGRDYYLELHSQFRRIVEESLSACFPLAQVFWATREKPKPNEMPPAEGIINETIFELNQDYHAHHLLSALSQFQVGRSHVFSICKTTTGGRLVCHPMGGNDDLHDEDRAWQVDLPMQQGLTVEALCAELRQRADSGTPQRRAEITERIKQQIDEWTRSVIWPDSDFRSHLLTASDRDLAHQIDEQAETRDEEGWPAKFLEAAKHMALIALYQAHNDFAAMSYILAPTLHGESESSLVIYWPRSTGEGPLHLLHLLQMVVGQNSTAILARDRESLDARRLAEARKMALGHLGHTLKHRLDTLKAFLDQHAHAGLGGHVQMLYDLTVILQLNTLDNRHELLSLEPRKRDRFLEYAGQETAPPPRPAVSHHA